MSGTTLDSGLSADSGLLARLSRPAEVNYLGAYGDANKVAESVWRNRLSQANQASGEAYQGAINQQTGEFDPQEYRRRLAGAGPTAALAAQSGLTTNQNLSDQQLEQAFKKLGFVQKQAGALLDGGDLSDAAIMRTFQTGITSGVMTLPEVQRQLQMLPQDAAGRQKWAEQHRDSALSTQQQLEQQYGTNYTQNEGGTIGSGVTAPARRGGGQTGATSTTMTVSPDTAATQVGRPLTDPKEAERYGVPVGTTLTEPMFRRLQQQGGGHLVVQPPTPSPIPGGGVYKPRGAAAPAPGAPPGATPAPSTPTATPSSQAPSTATPAPTTPEQPSAAPPYKGVVTSMPPGTEDTLKNDIALRTKAATDMGGMQKRLIAGQSALDALNIARTGPGTANETHMLAFLQAHNYDPPPKGQMSDTEYRQILVKNLLRFAQDSGRTAGTDLGLETQIHSNANADEMLNGANRHVLLQDLGILKRDIAQTEDMPEPSVGGAVREHLAKFPANTDPRAFMIDHLSPEDQKALLDEAKKQGPNGKIYRSLEIAHRRGYITPPSQSAPAAAPPPPAPVPAKSTAGRPLAMAPTNYLAMA